jgi:hypothetical protein
MSGTRLSSGGPLTFSKKIFCPDGVPGLKSPVNGFSDQMTDGAVGGTTAAIFAGLTFRMTGLGCGFTNSLMSGAVLFERRLLGINPKRACCYDEESIRKFNLKIVFMQKQCVSSVPSSD